jgi:hypothetical protein
VCVCVHTQLRTANKPTPNDHFAFLAHHVDFSFPKNEKKDPHAMFVAKTGPKKFVVLRPRSIDLRTFSVLSSPVVSRFEPMLTVRNGYKRSTRTRSD